jgi:hypothetical protein
MSLMTTTTVTEPSSPLLSRSKRISRKPVPKELHDQSLSEKYPSPDPEDPFAPLSFLRSRQGSNPDLFLLSRKQLEHNAYDSRPSTSHTEKSIAQWENTYLPHSEGQDRRGHSLDREPGRPHYRRRSQSIPSPMPFKEPTLPGSPGSGYKDLQSFVFANSPSHNRRRSEFGINLEHRIVLGDDSTTTSGSSSHGSSFDHLALPIEQSPSRKKSPLLTADDLPLSPPTKSRGLARLLSPKKSRSDIAEVDTSFHTPPTPQLPSSPLVSSLVSSPRPRSITHSILHSPALKQGSNLMDIDDESKVNQPIGNVPTESTVQFSPLSSFTLLPGSSDRFSFSDLSSSQPNSRPHSTVPRRRRGTLVKLPRRPHTNAGLNNRFPRDKFRRRHMTSDSRSDVLPFDEHMLPTKDQLSAAASLVVISENGVRIPFGDLWANRKTVVCFIRHFWSVHASPHCYLRQIDGPVLHSRCSLCQDYMFSISKDVDPKVLQTEGLELVIISNGSYNMIKSYRGKSCSVPRRCHADEDFHRNISLSIPGLHRSVPKTL